MKRIVMTSVLALFAFATLDCESSAASHPSASASAGKRTEYVCPMHREVTDTRPRDCPKCGMKLVPAKK